MTTLDIVEEIVDERVNSRGATEYLIKWVFKDEDGDDKSWEPEKKIRGFTKIVAKWEDKKKGRATGASAIIAESASSKGSSASIQDAAKNAKLKKSYGTGTSSSVAAPRLEEPGPTGSANVNDLPGKISRIMEECKKGILEELKSLKGKEDNVKEKDFQEKFKVQEVNYKRKLEQLEEKHLKEKKVLETALRVANMNLAKKRKMEEKKNVDERKEMEERIKTLEANQLRLKDFFCNILEEDVDMDHLEDKMPRVLEKIKEINDNNAKKPNQIKKKRRH